MEKTIFKNRESHFPNRRKIKIISQNASEILADVEMADEPSEEGTSITAQTLSVWQDTIIESNAIAEAANNTANTAKLNSESAINTANTANDKSDTAVNTANEANTKSDNAVAVANSANATAEYTLRTVVEKQGTIVTENGIYKPTFDADTKVNVNNYNIDQGTLNQRIQELEQSVALKSDIPTNYVTTNTTQAISGAKTFSSNITITGILYIN